MSFTVSIQPEDFDLSTEVAALRAADPGVGAVCSFVGTVREFDPFILKEAPEAIEILLQNAPELIAG